MSERTETGRPLLICDDQPLVDELLRLAAAAGVSVELAAAPGDARASWRTAPLVLVGGDVVADAVRLGLPPRRGVVVVSHTADTALFQGGMSLQAEQVSVLPEGEAWLIGRLADVLEEPHGESVLVCVVGGRGGAGASTTAAALALTAMRMGMRSFLVDGDPLGGGIDLVLGGEDTDGLRWPDLVQTRGRVSGSALRAALPRIDELHVLSWDRGDRLDVPPEAMRAVLAAGSRCSDVVVADLPRRIDDAAAEALTGSTTALLVVPAEVRAVASAARVARAVRAHAADVRLLVRGPAPTGLTAETIASSLDLPLAGDVAADHGLPVALDRGEFALGRGRGGLGRFCKEFLARLVDERRAA
ncbi:MAG TPA: septum site-determining protein Ssd [Streptosporangiales bacterium]